METITKEDFYTIVNEARLDIIPRTQLPISNNKKCKTEWKMRNGDLVAIEIEDTTVYPHKQDFFINLDYNLIKEMDIIKKIKSDNYYNTF